MFKIFMIRMVRFVQVERHYFQDFVDEWLGLVRLRTLFSKYFINMIRFSQVEDTIFKIFMIRMVRFSQVERGYVQNIYN